MEQFQKFGAHMSKSPNCERSFEPQREGKEFLIRLIAAQLNFGSCQIIQVLICHDIANTDSQHIKLAIQSIWTWARRVELHGVHKASRA